MSSEIAWCATIPYFPRASFLRTASNERAGSRIHRLSYTCRQACIVYLRREINLTPHSSHVSAVEAALAEVRMNAGDRAQNPRSPSPSTSPICLGMGMGVPSPICRGSGVHPHPHWHPRFAGDWGSSPGGPVRAIPDSPESGIKLSTIKHRHDNRRGAGCSGRLLRPIVLNCTSPIKLTSNPSLRRPAT